MAVNQVLVVSKDSTLISVDAKGSESKLNAPADSSSGGRVVSSDIRPGGRVEISGGTSAQMIISEAVTAHLEPGTQIEIPKLVEGQKPTTSLKLLKGKMFITVDAAKLKKDGNVEFRLETPKSLLAVKGTKFVAATGEPEDTVALIEGSLALRDQATNEFATLRPGQATSVSGEGKLLIRQLTTEESNYSAVFDESQLAFVPYEIDAGTISTAGTQILPVGKNKDASNWLEKPNILRAKTVQFEGYSAKGIRADYARGNQLYQELWLALQFFPRRMEFFPENSIGMLVKARIAGPVEPSFRFIAQGETHSVQAQGKLSHNNPLADPGDWQSYFFSYKYGDKFPTLKLSNFNFRVEINTPPESWLNNEPPDHLSIEIASIQIVTLGENKK